MPRTSPTRPLVSVIIPARNEAGAVGDVIRAAREAFDRCAYEGEVIVVDSHSSDGTPTVAREAGARVVMSETGYGNACRKGFAEARGDYLLLVDGDGTYDVEPLHRFIEPLRSGVDMVVGTRRHGTIHSGAMTSWHRHVLEPLQAYLLRRKLNLPCSDVRTGMRSIRRDSLDQLHLTSEDMGLAPEMIQEAVRAELDIIEVPVPFRPRNDGPSRRRAKDGWVVLRDILLMSPLGLFLVPGTLLFLFGFVLEAALLAGPINLGPVRLDYHFMFVGGAAAIFGVQLLLLGLTSGTYTLVHDPIFAESWMRRFHAHYTLERGILTGFGLMAVGIVILMVLGCSWVQSGMGEFFAVRPAMTAFTLMVLGGEVSFGSFLLSMLRKGWMDED